MYCSAGDQAAERKAPAGYLRTGRNDMKNGIVYRVLAGLVVISGLIGCTETEPEPAEPEETETAAVSAEPAPTEEIPEATKQTGETRSDVHYSDAQAFAGFASYTAGSRSVTFGETVFAETGLPADTVTQYADDVHEGKNDPELIEAGASAVITTGFWAKTGGELQLMVYNNTGGDIPAEECVIIGVMNEDGVCFANGITWYSGIEEIVNILGEPYRIDGKVSEDYANARYIWRDEDRMHELVVSGVRDGDSYECGGMAYSDYTLMNR